MPTQKQYYFVVFFIDLFSPNILLVYAREIGNKPLFTYKQKTEKGPAEWGKLDPQWKVCSTGKIQSPIDLTDERVSLIHDQALSKHYKPASAVIQSRGHDVMVSWKGDGGKITIHQTDYKLVQCHWHSPSEHTINGTSYDLELHMVHTSASGKTTVVGVLYKLGEPDEFLTKILNGIKGVGKKEIDLGIVDPRDIRFETNNFYRYIGSLTIPPCTEGVIWTVQKRVLYFFCFCYRLIIFVNTISKEQITALREAVDDGFEINSRPVQDPHGRSVWFHD
ncbi:putative carbonic anhydrase [Arabidopsis thaliana]